jgi:putative ABC transport system permease protein
MRWQDNLTYSAQALARHKTRTLLLLLTVAIGVCSVLLLTGLGEGAKHYINQEFSAMGSEILVVLPGRKETTGGAVPFYGTSPRDLTIEDANAIAQMPAIKYSAPIIAGTALLSHQGRSQEVITLGTNADFFRIRQLKLAQGQALPQYTDKLATPICIIGENTKKALFGQQAALGKWLRISGQRFRIIGILAKRGESLGLDLRDMVVIPVRSAAMLFNTPQLFRILLSLKHANSEDYVEAKIRQLIKKRHEGEDDITLVRQNTLMSAFTNIIDIVTGLIAAIASISLVVAGLLMMNVSYITVNKRRQEIGLLKALGASSSQIRSMFLTESCALICAGVALGLMLGYLFSQLFNIFYPAFILVIPWWASLASTLVSLVIGIAFTWLPASLAARQDPVLAMRAH